MRSWGSDYTKGADSGWLIGSVDATRSAAAETMGGDYFLSGRLSGLPVR